MNPLTSVSLNAAGPVSAASARKPAAPAKEEAPVETAGDQAVIGEAPAAEKPSGRSLGKIGRAAAVLALVGALSGCAVTTGSFGAYGYSTETVGVTPNGTVYQHNTVTTPWGTSTQSGAIGPGGVHYHQNHYPNGYYYVPRMPVCTPPTYWSPGTCY